MFFLTAFHRDQLVAVASKFTKNTSILLWDKATGNKSKTEQVPDPLGVLSVVLVALYGSYPLGIGNGDTDATFFKIIEHGNPILARGLHTNIKTVVCEKPVGEAVKIGIVGRKAFLLVVRLYSVSSRDDRSD